MVAIGFGLRMVPAMATFLNPDEALHYLLANQRNVVDAYQASLTNAHPPLFFLLLYFWRFLGNSEIMLRLPSVLAGTAVIWVGYRWLRRALGDVPAVVGLVLFAITPTLVSISTEVRAYALFLCFAVCALYFLERAFREKTARMMGWFALFLYLATLTHYSALWLWLALGGYVLVRVLSRELPLRVTLTWAGVQVGALALYAFLYVTHVSKLRGSGMEQEATGGWLSSGYFQAGHESLIRFIARSSVAVFDFLFALRRVGVVIGVLFLIAVILLLAGRGNSGTLPSSPAGGRRQATDNREMGVASPISRAFGALLLLPFVIACAGGVARLYPFTGTRHLVFLAPFAIAGVAFLVGQVAGRRLWPVLLAAVVAFPIWQSFAALLPQSLPGQNRSRKLMGAAIAYLRGVVPKGGLIFTDYQTSVLLGYYLGRNEVTPYRHPEGRFYEFDYGGYQVVSARAWSVAARDLDFEVAGFRQEYHLDAQDPVWIVDGGWGQNIADELARLSGNDLPRLRYFGRNLAVFQQAGSSESSSSPVIAHDLFVLAQGMAEQSSPRVKSAFWPTAAARDSAMVLLDRMAERTLRYADVYHTVHSNQDFERYLPALAFWVFDNIEFQSEPLSYMNDRENYIAGGYRFTLLTVSPDSATGVYLITKQDAKP